MGPREASTAKCTSAKTAKETIPTPEDTPPQPPARRTSNSRRAEERTVPATPPAAPPADSSRKAFLAAMGMSEEDLNGATTEKSTQSYATKGRRAEERTVPATPPAAPPADSSRQAFLAAMGMSEEDLIREAAPPVPSRSHVAPLPETCFSPPSMMREEHGGYDGYTSIPLSAMTGDDDEFPLPPSTRDMNTNYTPATGGRRKSKTPSDPILDAEAARVTHPTCEQLKSFGNRYYDLGDFRKAVRYYGQALKMDPDNAVLYSNRSAAYLQGGEQLGMDTTSMALRDATKACELKPEWAKAWTRKGDAYLQMDRYEEAAECFQRTVELDPTNARAREQLAKCGGFHPSRPRSENALNESSAANYQNPTTSNASLQSLVGKLNENLTQNRNMPGNDYLAKEIEKFRASQNKRTTPQVMTTTPKETPPPLKADEMTVKLGFTSQMASSYRDELLSSYRCRKGDSAMKGSASKNADAAIPPTHYAAINRW